MAQITPATTGNQNDHHTSTSAIVDNVNDPVTGDVESADDTSMVHVEVESNADLYNLTPPTYTQSIADGEQTVDCEAVREEKNRRAAEQAQLSEALTHTSPRPVVEHMVPRPETPLRILQERAREHTATIVPTGPTPVLTHYLTEPVVTASLAGARACSILHDRPAIWLVKKRKMALSPLAAAVLTREGLIGAKELELMSQHASARRDPTDPLSGVLLGVYDSVGEIMLGLVSGPVELGRQATPMLNRFELRQRDNPDGNTQPVLVEDVKGAPHAAGKVVIETGKGLARIGTAGLKSPMLMSHGLTRGFHNMPKLYGEEVREFENVTGFRSGMKVSAQSFGYGLGEGLLDLIAKPIEGAERNGIVGFTTGIGKGIGNALFKPSAGACGIVGYSSLGIYKSIRNLKVSNKNKCQADLVRALGDEEYNNATDTDKLYIVRVWCQTMMRVRLA